MIAENILDAGNQLVPDYGSYGSDRAYLEIVPSTRESESLEIRD